MSKKAIGAILLLMTALVVACGPFVTVENKTKIPVRVVVTSPGRSDVLSPSPGESSSAEVDEGAYSVAVIPDQEWIEYAKLTRQVLNDRLANSQNLTGAQLLDVVQRLKDIASKVQQFEQAAAGKGAGCRGSVGSDSGGGRVQVNIGVDGTLVVSCK